MTDATGVAAVTATVTGAGTTSIPMSKASGSSTYTATYTVPANMSSDGKAQVYSVVISAVNTAGSKSSAPAIQITVPAPDSPPPPPPYPS